MNLIVICADTFRADYLGCYGDKLVHTPNLDALARKSIVFKEMYGEGLPTLQCRTVFFTGHRIVPTWRVKRHKGDWGLSQNVGWHPLDNDEVTMSEVLSDEGYFTALVTDTLPMIKPGSNFNRGFDSWQWIRGQHNDHYVTGPRDKPSQFKIRTGEQYRLNTMNRRDEKDYFVAQVMRTAAKWLTDNTRNTPFFLWVDCFDPHEPWDPPDEYARKYDPDISEPRLIYPMGRGKNSHSASEITHIKALYAGEVTLVDKWIGYLLDRVKKLGLEKDTIIVFISDHGTILGEHGYVRKQFHLLIKPETRLPFIIYHPDQEFAGEKVEEFTQAQDLMPTLFSLVDVRTPAKADGKNAWNLVTGKAKKLYDYVISAYSNHVSIRDKQWNYITPYVHPDIETTRFPLFSRQLYNLVSDPKERNDVLKDHLYVENRMRRKLKEYGIKEFPEINNQVTRNNGSS